MSHYLSYLCILPRDRFVALSLLLLVPIWYCRVPDIAICSLLLLELSSSCTWRRLGGRWCRILAAPPQPIFFPDDDLIDLPIFNFPCRPMRRRPYCSIAVRETFTGGRHCYILPLLLGWESGVMERIWPLASDFLFLCLLWVRF